MHTMAFKTGLFGQNIKITNFTKKQPKKGIKKIPMLKKNEAKKNLYNRHTVHLTIGYDVDYCSLNCNICRFVK